MKILLLAVALVALTACQNRKQLEQEYAVAQLRVELDQKAESEGRSVCPALTSLPTNAYLKQCGDLVAEHQATLAELERKLR